MSNGVRAADWNGVHASGSEVLFLGGEVILNLPEKIPRTEWKIDEF